MTPPAQGLEKQRPEIHYAPHLIALLLLTRIYQTVER